MKNEQQVVEDGLFNDTSRYQDIMDLNRPEPRGHLRMPQSDRAAQFAPFAALTGYQEQINQIAARYERKHYPTAQQMAVVTGCLHRLEHRRKQRVRLNYFNEACGYYQTTEARLTRVDWDRGVLLLEDQPAVAIANVRRIIEIKA